MLIPYTYKGKTKKGTLTPLTGKPGHWLLHSFPNNYIVGTLIKEGDLFKFINQEGSHPDLAAELGKRV